jgi:hypothetical protein
LAPHGKGTGVQDMTDRLDAIGGSLEITSDPGRGTTVVGADPVPPAGDLRESCSPASSIQEQQHPARPRTRMNSSSRRCDAKDRQLASRR